MKITDELISCYLKCKYRAFLRSGGNNGTISDYELLQTEIRQRYEQDVTEFLIASYSEDDNILPDSPNIYPYLAKGREFITDLHLEYASISTHLDALIKVSGESILGTFHYTPILFCENHRITNFHKTIVAYQAYILGSIQGRIPQFAYIIYGLKRQKTRVEIKKYLKHVHKIIQDIQNYQTGETLTAIILNSHCGICEFQDLCMYKALEQDNLSLLSGLGEKEIRQQNKKGIFTVTQYSYTFRPRKRNIKSKKYRHYGALKALAIREHKIFIYGMPELPSRTIDIYMDVEGDPERRFDYLVGLVIVENQLTSKYSLWADSQQEEIIVFNQLLQILRRYENYRIFHFGSYELSFFKRISKKLDEPGRVIVSEILKKCIDIFSVVHFNVYVPTFSNRLKDIGKYLGFGWTNKKSSGIQSIVWRKRWEMTKAGEFKQLLIDYNIEDCLALKQVTDFIYEVIGNSSKDSFQGTNIIHTQDLVQPHEYAFKKQEFVNADMEYINKCSYFDYQREKIFVRTNENLRRIQVQKKKKNKYLPNINEHLVIDASKCPNCENKQLYTRKYTNRRDILDLKFSSDGVKRWVIRYSTFLYVCKQCQKQFIPTEYKNNHQIYGHGLVSWCVYQYVVNRQSYEQIQKSLLDVFSISIPLMSIYDMKSDAVNLYQSTYEKILANVTTGCLIHADETDIKLTKEKGYVWVFTNMEYAVYLYRPTREGDFLHELLKDFRGILISDFYSAYDSIDCPQQKCLVHLIRDLNKDLLLNPFDDEFKELVRGFTTLLRKVITTIDKYGLKQRNLNKHKFEAKKYLDQIGNKNYTSEVAAKYQKRFKKNEDKLFTFLYYDGIPWNNNHAEHAIKTFAHYRALIDGRVTETGMKQYLVLLSIYQTCKYKGVNFLDFLLSRETDIDKFKSGCTKSLRYNVHKLN